MSSVLLAAVRCDHGDVDALLNEVGQTLCGQGKRVQGALQTRGLDNGECHCADMDLQIIGSDRSYRISQSLGPQSRGCRLNSGALAECAAYLEQNLSSDVDLLILNRFGRGESEGKGFRDLIGAAIASDVPVLTALRPAYVEAWAAFGAEMACELPTERSAVLDWFQDVQDARACA
ncbi:DUF2478 domain-containing protein [Denitrobaculum tricleocarpae]|uniref:DUF2478 domain-containing protein n=1 Tax=Denitrobaculum tricleocarpae TaxID=2591009 RepID=A0A545TFV1_9PROT|nr:DUF2478 domain-containing protein [Denitrobaculum tricleocarpae]TQV76104.1 DUF2478 domain-containing protein [Denitrobaculum tricleocarpae]